MAISMSLCIFDRLPTGLRLRATDGEPLAAQPAAVGDCRGALR